VRESKADMQKRGQASPDDGDALALTFAQAVKPAEVEEEDEEEDSAGMAVTATRVFCRSIPASLMTSPPPFAVAMWCRDGLPLFLPFHAMESRQVRFSGCRITEGVSELS
jgi:hypothetical protein